MLMGATSASAATTLTLAWDPPTETTTTGYVLRYGTASGKYTASVDVGFVQQYSVAGLSDGTTYCFVVQAYNREGGKSSLSAEVCGKTPDPPSSEEPAPPPADPIAGDPATGDLVLYASKAAVVRGNWSATASAGAAGGLAIRSADRGWATPDVPLAAPADYFEMTFLAAANTPYTVWLRLRASSDSKWNDAVWVQFSDALVNGNAKYRIGGTSALLVNLENCEACGVFGWGWQNTAYWLNQGRTITFANSGTHTIRVQTREDGVEIDQIVLRPAQPNAPGPVTHDTTIFPESPTGGGAPSISEILIYASQARVSRGNWARAAAANAAGGQLMRSADHGWASPDIPYASPEDYFDLTFDATANTSYRVWLRLRAGGNSKWNDAVWVQFSGALVNGKAAYRTGTTSALLVNLEACDRCGVSGWGWQNTAYWLQQPTIVSFATSGTKTVRIQTREDGVEIDQIVLSAAKYMAVAPGPVKNDSTILTGTGTEPASTAPSPYSGTPIAIPGKIDAAYFDHGGADIAYADTTPGNSGGVFRDTDVDLQVSSLGGHNIAWTAAGEWVTYTVNVQSAGNYTAKFRVASRGGGALQIAAGAPSNSARDVAVPDTREVQSWTAVSVPIALAAGPQTITVRFLTGNVSLHAIAISM